jgi:putative transposase
MPNQSPYNPAIHHRRSIRLKGYDYSSPGYYFVTICAQNRLCLFGEIINDKMILNDAGKMIQNNWKSLSDQLSNIRLDEYVVMPNHFHAILQIVSRPMVFGPTVFGPIVGAPLVGALHSGQPQGIAPTNATVTCNGQPQLHSGQPQGIAPTNIAIMNAPVITANAGKTLGEMVGAFQSMVTVEYIRGVKTNKWQSFDKKLWQRNYWEHIIRNEHELINIRRYIKNNPANWDQDKFNNHSASCIKEESGVYGKESWMI